MTALFVRAGLLIALSTLTFTACQGHSPAPEGEAIGEHGGADHHGSDQSAHGKHGQKPESAPTTRPEDIKPNDGTRKVGDITKCPVTGDVFTIAEDTFSTQYEGKAYYLCCDGCEKKFLADPVGYLTEAPRSESTTNAADVLPNDGTRKVGDITKCPVSGDVFKVSSESASTEHKGGTYYFCCKGCINKFKANPERFTRQ